MAEPFIGEIKLVGFNFPPRGWATCDGQLLPIAQNTALFSLLGTTYGGDGRTTFGLPDLRGRVPVHVGTGSGLTPRTWGQRSGSETDSTLPAHTHQVAPPAASGEGQVVEPGANYPAAGEEPVKPYASTTDATMATFSSASAGSSVPSSNNMQPFLALYFVIALTGLFPSRN